MGHSFGALESSQITLPLLSSKLSKLGEIHARIGEITSRHAEKDVLLLCSRVDEYLRYISSIKLSFLIRNKVYEGVVSSEALLNRRKDVLSKYDNMKIRTDKISVASAEVVKAQLEVEQVSSQFSKCTTLLLDELERVDLMKMRDFKTCLKEFCRVMLDCHLEMVGIWKTYHDVGSSGGVAIEQ